MHKLKKTKSKKDEWFRIKLSNQKLSIQLKSYYINLKYYKNLKKQKHTQEERVILSEVMWLTIQLESICLVLVQSF